MANQKQEVTEKTEKTETHVTPAGGESDSEAVNKFVKTIGSVVRSEDGRVSINVNKSYTRIALEAALPTAAIVGGIVVGVATLVLIDNKWGNGARANRLIERGAFDKLAGADDATLATVQVA